MRKNGCWMLLVLLSLLLSNCATAPRSGPSLIPYDQLHQSPPAEARTLLDQAEQQQKAGDLKAAVSSWERVARSYPNNAVAAEAFCKLGDFYLRQGQIDRALEYFDYLTYSYPQWRGIDLAKIGRLDAYWRKGKDVEDEVLTVWESSSQRPEIQYQVSQLMVAVAKKEGEVEKGFGWAATGFAAAKTPQQKEILTRATVDLLKEADESTIRRLLQKSPNDFMRLFLDFRLAQMQLEKQPSEQNKAALYSLLQQNPGHPLALEIQASLRGAAPSVTLPLHADRIGCLIPLNGPYRKYGGSVLRGVALAEREWNQSHPDQRITLTIKDTSAEPEVATKSFEDLAKDDGVLAVVGPLGVKPAKAVFPIADKWNVPVLALSQKEEDTGGNPYVLHVFLDNRDLVRTLVKFCREKLNYTNFATLYPDDRYGQRLSKAFAEAVQEMDGKLLASVSYEPNSTDFKGPIQNLVATAKKNASPSGVDSTPFQALFIPDQVQTVALIAPQLPYYNVVGATLLGTNLWGEGPLAQAGGAFVENALFATPFFADSNSNAAAQQFRQSYQNAYGTAPTYLEAQAYDALMMLLQARSMSGGSSIDRAALLQNLLQMHEYPGVTGTLSFTPDGKMSRDYLVLQVSNARTVQVYP